jgi:hypothetical protein
MRQRLERALELLEYLTHHDGRDDQHRGEWQRQAQKFVHEARAFLLDVDDQFRLSREAGRQVQESTRVAIDKMKGGGT